jgi:hypothetical protein
VKLARSLGLDISHKLVEALPAGDVQPTTAMVGIFLDDLHVVGRCVLADDVELVFPANTADARSTCGRIEPREMAPSRSRMLKQDPFCSPIPTCSFVRAVLEKN